MAHDQGVLGGEEGAQPGGVLRGGQGAGDDNIVQRYRYTLVLKTCGFLWFFPRFLIEDKRKAALIV